MVAYAALISLLQILDSLLDPAAGGRQFLDDRVQLHSLREKVSFLLDFLKDSPSYYGESKDPELESLETQIREAAYKAEDVIESNISNLLLAEAENVSFSSSFRFLFGLFILVSLSILVYVAFQIVVALWIPILMPVSLLALLLWFLVQILSVINLMSRAVHETAIFWFLPRFLFVFLFTHVLSPILLYMALKKAAFWIQILIPFMYAIPTSVRYLLVLLLVEIYILLVLLLPLVLLVRFKFLVQIPSLVIFSTDLESYNIIANTRAEYWMRTAVLWMGRYWLNNNQPEYQDLRKTIEDMSIMEETIKIKYASIRVSGEGTNPNLISSPNSKKRLRMPVSSKKNEIYKDSYGSVQSDDGSDYDMSTQEIIGENADSDLIVINARLFGHSDDLVVVSIVGMGGVGKTTLARLVYDGPHSASHFDIRAWVRVSQEHSLCGVMLCLLDSANMNTEEILRNHRDDDWEELGLYLYRVLVGRRYLIVMDDVWDRKIWDFVRRFFPDNGNRSRVILTTRLSEVASYACSPPPPLQMQFLNDNDSWYLLREKVFKGERCAPELKAIGRTIARKCGGLPLAIIVVGGILSNEHKTVQKWIRVSRNLNSLISEYDERCWEILGLSYKQLPHRLKPCFLYMGAYPQGEEIHVTKLFKLWAAEGFLEASESKSLEEVAEDYLQDLIQRSLIIVGKYSSNGKIKTCKIHALLRDVCLLNAREENFVDFGNQDGAENGRRRLSTNFVALSSASDDLINCYTMARSLICVGETFSDLSHIYSGFRLLRVLDVVAAKLFAFPDAILKLVLLRYLGLSLQSLKFPRSISRLWNLQTIVVHCALSSGLRIPVEIWSMPNLRHLYFRRCLWPHPPRFQLLWKSTVLENLQTLVGVLDFQCTKGILKSILNLKKLGICYSDFSPVDWSDCQLESLINLQKLENLKIVVEYSVLPSVPKLAFPQNLKKLTLSGCRLPWASMRMIGALPNLKVLKLRREACSGPSWETVEGEFPELIFLLLEQMSFRQWETEADHFPHLQRLAIRSCGMLEEIPSAVGDISTLEMIELEDCHPSAVVSAEQIQEEQESMGNEVLKVRILP